MCVYVEIDSTSLKSTRAERDQMNQEMMDAKYHLRQLEQELTSANFNEDSVLLQKISREIRICVEMVKKIGKGGEIK
jgi:hypothetical protein